MHRKPQFRDESIKSVISMGSERTATLENKVFGKRKRKLISEGGLPKEPFP